MTIDAIATVTDDHMLRIETPAPASMPPGEHRVVLTVSERREKNPLEFLSEPYHADLMPEMGTLRREKCNPLVP